MVLNDVDRKAVQREEIYGRFNLAHNRYQPLYLRLSKCSECALLQIDSICVQKNQLTGAHVRILQKITRSMHIKFKSF